VAARGWEVVSRVLSDFEAARGWGVVGGVFSDLVGAKGWGVVSGLFADFVFANAEEWWVEYVQILWLPGA